MKISDFHQSANQIRRNCIFSKLHRFGKGLYFQFLYAQFKIIILVVVTKETYPLTWEISLIALDYNSQYLGRTIKWHEEWINEYKLQM